jgi:hypothetical protein
MTPDISIFIGEAKGHQLVVSLVLPLPLPQQNKNLETANVK